MRERFLLGLAALVLPLLGAGVACTPTEPLPGGAPDSGVAAPLPGPDAGTPDTSPDATAPDAQGADAGDAGSAPDGADAAPPAVTTTLPFATGLDGNRTPLADGLIDSHWTVKDAANVALTAFVQTEALGYPGYWMRPSATSKFISPFVDTVDPSAGGTFTYTTTFSLRAGTDGKQLVVRCASDNEMTAVTLNGQAVPGVVAGGYSSFQTLNVAGPFVDGVNTVALVVHNTGGPTGLRAELDLTCVTGACNAVAAATVPFAPQNPAFPHPALAGAATLLKGIALGGATEFMWDFGDGTAPTAWTKITDPNNLGVAHTYVGAAGQLFEPTLTVRTALATSAPALYPVRLADPSAALDPHLDIATDSALWYLHTTAARATYAAGAPGYGQPYASFPDLGSVCAAAEAFERQGSSVALPITIDPYSEDVRRLTNFVFASLSSAAIGVNAAGNPDVNGNGLGLTLPPSASGDNVAWAACAQALGRIGDVAYVVPVGGAQVRGRALGDVAQDLAEWLAWSQSTVGGGQLGGWAFAGPGALNGQSWQYGTGWATLALSAYARLGVSVPGYVKTNLASWTTTSRQASGAAPACGGWAELAGSSSWPVDNLAAADGILEQLYAGVPLSPAALGNLYGNWDATADNCHSYASQESYALAEALRASGQSRVTETSCNDTFTANSFPWYTVEPADTHSALATTLLAHQGADGHWTATSTAVGGGHDCFGLPDAHATAWSAATILGERAQAQVRAGICNCNVPRDVNAAITFDASCTQMLDASAASPGASSYTWDFNYDGTTFHQSIDSFGFAVAGMQVTKVDGFSTTGSHPVALLVKDGRGGQSLAVCNTIVSAAPSHCPVPSAGGGPTHIYLGVVGAPVQLDATATLNPAGDPLTYAWALHAPNQFVDSTSSQPTFTWNTAGTFAIGVSVTSNPAAAAGCTEYAYATVQIGP